MKSSKVILFLLTLAAIIFFLGGCKKNPDDTNPPATSKNSATDNALAENLFNNVKEWSDQAMAGTAIKSTLTDTVFMGACVLATLDTTASTWVLTIDFGSVNCLCPGDQKQRRGKIIAVFTGPYWAPGTVITYTFNNYFVDDNQVLGTKIVTNKGFNSSSHLWWEITENGSVIKAKNGGTITWISTRQLEWTEGMNTLWEWWDDVYQLTGESHGVNSEGADYQYNITTPLKKKLNCQWIVSGILTLQVTGLPLITMDWGDGACNNNADIMIDGVTYPITLP
jgi:hypothetical protein